MFINILVCNQQLWNVKYLHGYIFETIKHYVFIDLKILSRQPLFIKNIEQQTIGKYDSKQKSETLNVTVHELRFLHIMIPSIGIWPLILQSIYHWQVWPLVVSQVHFSI